MKRKFMNNAYFCGDSLSFRAQKLIRPSHLLVRKKTFFQISLISMYQGDRRDCFFFRNILRHFKTNTTACSKREQGRKFFVCIKKLLRNNAYFQPLDFIATVKKERKLFSSHNTINSRSLLLTYTITSRR